jgi:hypothetical protein
MVLLLADQGISESTVLAVQDPQQNPHKYTTCNPFNSLFDLFNPPSAKASVCFFVHKSLNQSSYSATFPTPNYSYLCLQSSVKEARNIMVHNVCRTGSLFPTSSENQPPDEPLSVVTHEIFLHASATLLNAFAHHVLLDNFNIYHSI